MYIIIAAVILVVLLCLGFLIWALKRNKSSSSSSSSSLSTAAPYAVDLQETSSEYTKPPAFESSEAPSGYTKPPAEINTFSTLDNDDTQLCTPVIPDAFAPPRASTTQSNQYEAVDDPFMSNSQYDAVNSTFSF